MGSPTQYILCYGNLPLEDAAGLHDVLQRFGRSARGPSGVIREILRLGDDPPEPSPPVQIFSFCIYRVQEVRIVERLCQLLNAKYGEIERGNVCFAPWEGSKQDHRPLVDEQVQTIASFGRLLNDPLQAVQLRPGARRLGEYWLTARRLEKQLLAPASPAKGTTTYPIAKVLDFTGVSDTTLNTYAKQAGVATPSRGKRNHRYTAEEVRMILQTITDTSSDRAMVDRCRKALENL